MINLFTEWFNIVMCDSRGHSFNYLANTSTTSTVIFFEVPCQNLIKYYMTFNNIMYVGSIIEHSNSAL